MKDSRLKRLLLTVWDEAQNAKQLHDVRKNHSLSIMTAEETITHIKNTHCSVARFGDGELGLMTRRGAPVFQESSEELAEALLRVLGIQSKELLICMPEGMISTKGYKKNGRKFWEHWSIAHQKESVQIIRQLQGKSYRFGNANLSRPFSPYKTSENAKKLFPLLKELWEGQNLLIVEGEKTRLGVGNDLFSNAKSIKRILAPAENAFASYNEILSTVTKQWDGELVIAALGPTATVLAADLSEQGIQSLDLGHIDIQYEWYLKGNGCFQSVPGKYTSEVISSQSIGPCEDVNYLSQVVATIK